MGGSALFAANTPDGLSVQFYPEHIFHIGQLASAVLMLLVAPPIQSKLQPAKTNSSSHRPKSSPRAHNLLPRKLQPSHSQYRNCAVPCSSSPPARQLHCGKTAKSERQKQKSCRVARIETARFLSFLRSNPNEFRTSSTACTRRSVQAKSRRLPRLLPRGFRPRSKNRYQDDAFWQKKPQPQSKPPQRAQEYRRFQER